MIGDNIWIEVLNSKGETTTKQPLINYLAMALSYMYHREEMAISLAQLKDSSVKIEIKSGF